MGLRAGDIGFDELALAARNHGMPLEALHLDRTPAGLHYLLIHYDIPMVDPAAFRLRIEGSEPLELSLEDLRAAARVSMPVTLECAGNGRALMSPRPLSQPWLLQAVGTAEWTGTPLRPLLEGAGIPDDAVDAVFTGLDRGLEADMEQDYERGLPLADAMAEEVFVAYEMNGQPLPPQHGFPLRLVVPGWYGMAHVKWLARIRFSREPFDGYQNRQAYRFRASADEAGEPLSRIAPRSLMVPPGHPEFPTSDRYLHPGRVTLEGRAWSGFGAIDRVAVTTDDGATWNEAAVEPALGPHAWSRWTLDWDAEPGTSVLGSRATDVTGRAQPDEATWNTGGYANNAVQKVRVTVLPD